MEFDQGFIIRLNDHGKTVENIINHASHDVTLVCDGKEFLSNRIVLSACSPLLFSLLKEEPDTDSPRMMIVTDISSSLIDPILSFIHTGSMIINKADIGAVVAAASQLGIQSIEESKSGMGVSDSFVGGGALNDGENNLVNSNKKHCIRVPDGKEVIDEDTYNKMKNDLVNEELKLVKKDKTSTWFCGLCGKKWMENSRNVRRHARRHMESHLSVKFQCLNCGKSLNTKESLYYHRSNYCKHDYISSDAGFHILSSDNLKCKTIDKSDEKNIIIVEVDPREVNIKSDGDVDMSFLSTLQVYNETRQEPAMLSIEQQSELTAQLIENLQPAQNKRLSGPPPPKLGHAPPSTQRESKLAEHLVSGLALLPSKTNPGDLTAMPQVGRAMGVALPIPEVATENSINLTNVVTNRVYDDGSDVTNVVVTNGQVEETEC